MPVLSELKQTLDHNSAHQDLEKLYTTMNPYQNNDFEMILKNKFKFTQFRLITNQLNHSAINDIFP